jgi:hypothetical protein
LKVIRSVDSALGTRYGVRRLFLREESSLLRSKTVADFLWAYLSGFQEHEVLRNLISAT